MKNKAFSHPNAVYFFNLLWILFVLYACFRPSTGMPKVTIPHIDKPVHFILFAGVSFLSLLSIHVYKRESFNYKKSAIIVLLGTILLGYLVEVIQDTPLVNRSFEWADVLFDALGAACAVWLYRRIIN